MSRRADDGFARVEVDRTQFLEGLKSLARVTRPKTAGQAVLRYSAGELAIVIGGGEASASAKGRWAGEARVPGTFVLMLAHRPPAADPVPVWVEAGRLHVASTSVECEWQHAGAAQIDIPIGASLADVLRIGMEHDDIVLEQSGILAPILEARGKRKRLVTQAAALLERLDVFAEDIDALVDRCLRSRQR